MIVGDYIWMTMPRPHLWLHSRLSFMMFLHFFSLGAIIPIFSLYMIDVLHFTGAEAGIVLAGGSVATIISPLISAWIADRLISGALLFSILNFASGVFFLLLLGFSDFWGVFAFYVLVMLAKGPTFALSNSITFQNITDGARHFPLIRLWGTVGWISVAWFFGFFWLADGTSHKLSDAITLAALASFLLGFYSLTLPRGSAARPTGSTEPIESPAENPVRKGLGMDLTIFLVVTVVITCADRFYFFGGSVFLNQQGVDQKYILPLMSLGQVMEALSMAFMGWLLPRLGFRRTFLIGLGLQILRFALLAFAQVPGFLLVGVAIHGLTFTFFYTNAFVYIDSRISDGTRTKAHQLYIFLMEGVGVTSGNLLAGGVAQLFTSPETRKIFFEAYWLTAGGIAVACLAAFWLFFRPDGRKPEAGSVSQKPL